MHYRCGYFREFVTYDVDTKDFVHSMYTVFVDIQFNVVRHVRYIELKTEHPNYLHSHWKVWMQKIWSHFSFN